MASSTQSRNQPWNANQLLEIFNPHTHYPSCVGRTKRTHRRCRNHIAGHNFAAAQVMLTNLPGATKNEEELRQRLREIALLNLCLHDHRYQVENVVNKWYNTIQCELDRRGEARPSSSGSYDSRYAYSNGTRAGNDADERERAHKQEEERRREDFNRREQERREDARRQAEREAERERAQQEAEDRKRAEQERARREREREEASRQRQEQQARERAEQTQREWEQSWKRYDQDWKNMTRINTTTLNEDVRDSVPWPVKSGMWQDVSDRNIEEFFKHAPNGTFDNARRVRNLLRRQMLRWHEDKIKQFFHRIASDAKALRLTNVVMQVINKLTAGL